MSAKEGEMEGGKKVFVYRDRGKGNCEVFNDDLKGPVCSNWQGLLAKSKYSTHEYNCISA